MKARQVIIKFIGKKRKGLRIIKPNASLSKAHVKKSDHNLVVMTDMNKLKHGDWVVVAAYYSIFSTCLMNNVNLEEYLPDVLMRLAIRPEGADVKDLLPVNWLKGKNVQPGARVEYPEN